MLSVGLQSDFGLLFAPLSASNCGTGGLDQILGALISTPSQVRHRANMVSVGLQSNLGEVPTMTNNTIQFISASPQVSY